jgi:hypothetical protein
LVTTAKKPRRLSLSRTLSILLALAAIGAAGVVFEEKRQASKEARDIAKLKRKIDAEGEKISELKAEWSMLDQPARLQKIVELHPDVLTLDVMKTEQIGTIDDVPWPPPPPAPKEGAHDAATPPAVPLAAATTPHPAADQAPPPASEPATAPAHAPAPMPLGAAAEAPAETPADEIEETTFSPEVAQ